MNMRLKRLYNDYQELAAFLQDHPAVSLLKAEGDPPEKYQLQYRVKGLEQKAGQVVPKDRHTAEIVMTLDYPSQEPICRMLSPAFHPNIDPHLICITDRWAASESLVDVVVRIGRMLCYQIYNIKSPRNGEAAKWTAEHLGELPLDTADLALESISASSRPAATLRSVSPPPVAAVKAAAAAAAPPAKAVPSRLAKKEPAPEPEEEEICPNCRQKVPRSKFKECRNGHRVCPDCRPACRLCGAELCLLCDLTVCSICGQVVCPKCSDFCHFHRQPICRDHAAVCAECGVKGCSQCFSVCPECGRVLCRTHLDKNLAACPSCLQKKEKKAKKAALVCPRCGRVLTQKEAKFCPGCGQKLQTA
jgi:ubiquitin-protein ligase